MTKIIFADREHASGRLRQSLIRYQGEPVICTDVHYKAPNKFMVEAFRIKDGEGITHNLEEYDLTPVQIGNIECGKSFTYYSRKPERRWKQGLTTGSMMPAKMPWGRGEVRLNSTPMRKAIMGLYESFDDAYNMVMHGAMQAVAFDRNFGLGLNKDKVMVLTHRGKEVGMIDDDIFIDRKYFYLQEQLLSVLNK